MKKSLRLAGIFFIKKGSKVFENFKGKVNLLSSEFSQKLLEYTSKVSERSLGWFAIILLHLSSVPSLLAVMAGTTDRLPGVDLVLLVWIGLGLLFARAALQKDMLSLVTIGVGFMVQASLMALIFFK